MKGGDSDPLGNCVFLHINITILLDGPSVSGSLGTQSKGIGRSRHGSLQWQMQREMGFKEGRVFPFYQAR